MRLKTLREFAAESNAFDAALNTAGAAEEAQQWDSSPVIAWLRGCVAHGRYLPPSSPEREALQTLVDYWTSRLLQLGHARPDDVDRLAEFDPSAGVPLLVECPYPGLEPYSEGQRLNFFGREPLIRECVAHLEDPARRVYLIIGASGAGKSSLALAGVAPELEKRHQGEWLFAPPFTPGSEPLAALAASIARSAGEIDRTDAIAAMLAGGRLRELAGICAGKPVLLLVDQLEELFTLCRDVAKQKAFGDVLTALSAPEPGAGMPRCHVLLTLRTDHFARLETSDALRPLHTRLIAEGNHHYLSSISFADIHRAIAEPAKRVGLRFVPPDLINRLASQTASLASGLPLLQFALRRLWDTRPRNDAGEPLDLITADMVDALPDVQRALGTVAEGLFEQFTTAQRQICERLLQELVVLDENFEEPLRRRRNEEELTRVLVARQMGTADDVAAVISRFVAAGLLRYFGEGPRRQIEVAHEALLRHWDRINQLVTGQAVKERLHLVKQIGREASEWVGRAKSESYLTLRGERLDRAREYAGEGWLAEAESAEYVAACGVREQAEREREARSREAEEAARRTAKWKRRMIVGMAVGTTVLLMFIGLSSQLYESRQRAEAAWNKANNLALAMLDVTNDTYVLDPPAVREKITSKVLDEYVGQEDSAVRGLALAMHSEIKSTQGNGQEALTSARKALEVLHRARLVRPDDTSIDESIAYGYLQLGYALYLRSDTTPALEAYRSSLDAYQKLASRNTSDANLRQRMASINATVGDLLLSKGDVIPAGLACSESVAIADRLAKDDPVFLVVLAEAYICRGDASRASGDLDDARKVFEEAYEIRQARADEAPPDDYAAKHDLAQIHDRLGDLLTATGDWDGAKSHYEKSNDIFMSLAAQNPLNSNGRRNLAVTYERLGGVVLEIGSAAEALQIHQRARDIREELVTEDKENNDWQAALTVSHYNVGDAFAAGGKPDQALESYRKSLESAKTLVERDPSDALRQDLSTSYVKLAGGLAAKGRHTEALAAYEEALAITSKLVAKEGAKAEWRADLSAIHLGICEVRAVQRAFQQALDACRASVSIREQLAKQSPKHAGWQADLANAHYRTATTLAAAGGTTGSDVARLVQQSRTLLQALARRVKLTHRQARWLKEVEAAARRFPAVADPGPAVR